MEMISLKLEPELLREIDRKLKQHRYSTRTEFIRDAIRSKLSEFEKQEMLKSLTRLKGISKRKTTDEQVHAAGEKAFQHLEKKVNIK